MKKENNRYDIRCTRCGKHVDELSPFDIEIQSKVDVCIEGKLLKQFREVELVERNTEYDEILQKYAAGSNIIDLKKTYGERKVQAALDYDSYFGDLVDSWECKDCINDDGPFKRHTQCN